MPPSGKNSRNLWLGLKHWFRQNSFAPGWLPEPLRYPIIGYLVAVILELAAVAVILLLLYFFPSFTFHGVLTVVIVVLVALGWGAGPGLLATFVGTFLLYYAVLTPPFTLGLSNPADTIGLAMYLVVGVSISVLASRSEQRRRQTEELARGLARAEAKSALDYRRLHAVLEAMPSAVLIAGPQGQLEEINQATRVLWGGNIALAQGVAEYGQYKAWWPKTGKPVVPEEWAPARALDSGAAQLNDEMEIEALDGQHKIILNSAVPIRDESGGIIGAVINAQDISEMRRLERAMAERASELEIIFEAIGDGIALVDAQGNLVQTNRALRMMFGYGPQSELAALPVRERAAALTMRDEHGQSLPEERWPVFRLLQGETLTGTDILITTRDGRDVVCNVAGAPIRDETGRITGGVEVFRDVTARRQLEQRTRDTLNTLVAIGEELVQVQATASGLEPDEAASSPAADIGMPLVARRVAELTRDILDCRCVSMAAVDAATGLLSPITVVGLSPTQEQAWWASFSPPQSLDERLGFATAAPLRAGEPVVLDMTSLPDDTWSSLCRAQTSLMVPMRIGEELVGALMVDYSKQGRDYTAQDEMMLTTAIARLGALVLERDRLLRRWTEARANELAMRVTKEQMDTFLGMASHELKAPLTAIQLSLDLTERRLRAEMKRQAATGGNERIIELFQEHLTTARQQMERLYRLVNDLVDISRVQAGMLEFRLEACDLGDVVQTAVDTQRQAAPDRTISLQLPAEGRVPVCADSGRIEQVVTNYLTNALKYSPSDRPVEVGVRIEGRQARVWVRDEGPGLPEEEHERIWERFHRAKGIEVQSGTGIGLGLGLHICSTIIERHQGQVGVESAPGAGSTFWFTLPLAESAA